MLKEGQVRIRAKSDDKSILSVQKERVERAAQYACENRGHQLTMERKETSPPI
jgi:hypothetical protein